METKLRAWWAHRQGLDGSLAGQTAAQVFERSGWARSVAGCSPYLGLFARAGIGRKEADAALESVAIHELPSARGCTYVVPACDFGLALAAGQPFAGDEMRVASKLGVTDAEIGKLKLDVVKVLKGSALDPDGLRKELGDAVRKLGPEGVRKGITTTLPVALGLLQAEGKIRRVPMNGRLDQQRYRYALWSAEPLKGWAKSEEEVFTELGRKFFSWAGPAKLAEFQWFSGLSMKAVKAAVQPLGLEPLDESRFLLPEDRAEFEAFRAPKKPRYSLVGSLDCINLLRRDLTSLIAEEDMQQGFVRGRNTVAELPNHGIFDRGRLVGLWEFDPEAGRIVWISFVPRERALADEVEKTEAFVREDLGDARAFSLDSPRSRVEKIQKLREQASV